MDIFLLWNMKLNKNKTCKMFAVDIDNMTLSELFQLKKGFNCLTGYFGNVVRPLFFILISVML